MGGLARGARVELGGESGEERGAGAGEPGALAQPREVVPQLHGRPQYGAAGDEHVDMAGQAPQPGIGRGDQRPPGVLIACPHPSGMLGEGVDIGLRQAAPHVPHENPIPIGREHRQRFGAADVDIGKLGGRTDDPQARAPGFVDLVTRGRGRQPHGIEAEGSDDLERLTVVVEGPGEEGLPGHFEDPAIEA